jgi:hypothetical protein
MKLLAIQTELKAPKNQRNSFGNYNYRSAEDILEAVKPLLKAYDCLLFLSDSIESIGGRNYVKATATFHEGEKTLSVCAYAREEETKKGMDGSQITGAASSYARKYALNGLFLIDDTKDSDYTNQHEKEPKTAPKQPMQEPKKPSVKLTVDNPRFNEIVSWLANTQGASVQSLRKNWIIDYETEQALIQAVQSYL